MDQIELRPIDASNISEAFELKLAEEQERFVSHPIRSLALAYVFRDRCAPFGIYVEDEMIGYIMVLYDYELEEYNIWHMMIDKAHQCRGHGRRVLRKCLEHIGAQPFGPSRRVALTCSVDNAAALHLYRSMGFRETGAVCDDEIELALYMD